MQERRTILVYESEYPDLMEAANKKGMLISRYVEYAGKKLPELEKVLTELLQQEANSKEFKKVREKAFKILTN